MKILYHHRTRSTDAQRIHIQEIVRAFEALGHQVEMVSLVPTDAAQHDAARDAGEALWKRIVRRIPYGYEAVQLAYNAWGIPMLLSRIRKTRPDFLYERYSLFNFTGVAAARLCGLPLVLEVNSPFALEQGRDRDIRAVALARWTERVICSAASRVIVVSTPLRRILEAAGVRPGHCEVMSNGVALERFHPRPGSAELRRRLGLDGSTVIGFVGWFRKWHGLELLLEAYCRSGLAAERVKVLLIGDGPAMPELKAFAEQNGLHDHVLFTGPLPHPQIPPYLDLVDIAVQPAANEYCCPMKILEYMALAKPVVAPRQENIQELLREGEEAEYFTPGDAASFAAALRRLAGNPQRSARIGASARQAIRSRGYLWESNARRVVEMIQPKRAPEQRPDACPCQPEPSR